MKKLPLLLLLFFCSLTIVTSCKDDDDNWSDYTEWRETNEKWYAEQLELKDSDGRPFYTKLTPAWYKGSGVLIHYYNDTTLTGGNLRPLANSQVKVIYKGTIYNGEPFDSSYTMVDSAAIFNNGPDLILGWRIALSDMRVGDSADVVIPWQQAYGFNGNSGIPPYTCLKFGMKLVDITKYELKP